MRESRGVPVPLPADADAIHGSPDPEVAQALADGVATAAAPPTGLTHLQRVLIEALFKELTGRIVDVLEPRVVTPEAFAQLLAQRPLATRERLVQVMLLCALVLRPLPKDVATRIEAYAVELCVDD